MSFFNQEQTKKIISLSISAGEISKKYFRMQNLVVTRKSDNSKVTNADLEISRFFAKELAIYFPEIPLVCEEGDLREFDKEIFWLIDPIDGTSSFIDGSENFAISVALIKDRQPVFGLIYAPFFEGGKMVFLNHQNQVILLKNNQEKILELKKNNNKKIRIVTSPRSKDEEVNIFVEQFYGDSNKEVVIEKLSSAVKFFRLLENEADIYLHLRNSMEWDIAAGHALLKNMNGKVKNLFFNENKSFITDEMVYKKPNFANQFFIANF